MHRGRTARCVLETNAIQTMHRPISHFRVTLRNGVLSRTGFPGGPPFHRFEKSANTNVGATYYSGTCPIATNHTSRLGTPTSTKSFATRTEEFLSTSVRIKAHPSFDKTETENSLIQMDRQQDPSLVNQAGNNIHK